MVSWSVAKKYCSAQALERLGCVAWTMIENGKITDADWKLAIQDLDEDVQPASIRRQISDVVKKARSDKSVKAGQQGEANGVAKGRGGTGAKGGKKRGVANKRKSPVEDEDDQVENVTDKPKPKKGKGMTNAKGALSDDEDDEASDAAPIKNEIVEEDDDIFQ